MAGDAVSRAGQVLPVVDDLGGCVGRHRIWIDGQRTGLHPEDHGNPDDAQHHKDEKDAQPEPHRAHRWLPHARGMRNKLDDSGAGF